MYQITRLKSGLTVASIDLPHAASVSIGIWVGAGGRFETREISGVAHFIEHLLFKGTNKRTAREISQAVEGLGGYLNAFTSEEQTCFYAKAHHDHFREVLEVLTDMFLNSKFDPQEIQKERNVIKEELAMYLDQPQQYVQEMLNETLWPDHPLGYPLTGTPKTLDRIGREQMLGFMKSNYLAANTLIVAAGKVAHASLVAEIKKIEGRMNCGLKPTALPVRSEQKATRVRHLKKKTEQTQVALGIRTCSRFSELRFPLRLLNTILGENMSSRLFQSVREEHGLAYSVYSSPSFFEDTGVLTVSAGLETARLRKALTLIVKELKLLRTALVSPGELRRARDYVIGQMDLSLENTENQMMWIGEQLLGHGKVFTPDEIKQKLRAVTGGEIRRVAVEFFRPERMNMALISPLEADPTLERLIRL